MVAVAIGQTSRAEDAAMVDVPRLLLIGSTGRNAGKTTLASGVIERWAPSYPIVGLKVVTITGRRGVCQRGRGGCGICTSISSGYELSEERDGTGDKDTMRLLAAGATRAFFLRTLKDSLLAGFQDFLGRVDEDDLIVCESNSLRTCARPGVFLMLDNGTGVMKPTALAVSAEADRVATMEKMAGVTVSHHAWRLA